MPDDAPLTRRTVLQTSCAAAGIAVLGSGAASLPESDETTSDGTDLATTTDWPQLQGNAAKTGVAGGGPVSATVRWEHGADGREYHQPAVRGDSLYVSYASDDPGDTASGVVALTTDGQRRWAFETEPDTELLSDTAVGNGLAFVAGQSSDASECDTSTDNVGVLLALDAETGEEVYRRVVAGWFADTPTVADGSVYVVVPGQTQGDGTLVAFDAETGEEQWRYNTGPYGSSSYTAPPVAVDDGIVYVAAMGMAALDAENGSVVWERGDIDSLKSHSDNAPAVRDGTVYIGTGGYGGTLYALSAKDGSTEWTFESGTEQFSSAAVTSETAYVSVTAIDDPPEGTYALSAEDGSEQWFQTDVAVTEAPIRGDQYLYAGRDALAVEDGSIAWTVEGEHENTAVAGDTLYLGGESVVAVGEE
jgi:outer membrane protein assembly factor BamB